MSWRVVLADDEAPARAKFRRLLAADPRFALVAEARDGVQALALVATHHPDLLCLDIQMPGLTGFEVIQSLGASAPLALFATAFDQYALQAFEAHAVDYLLKPFDGRRLSRALDRCAALLTAGGGDPSQRALAADLGTRSPLRRLLVRHGEGWTVLPLDQVSRLRAAGKQVFAHGPEGARPLRQSLGTLEGQLDPAQFVRVHRGDLVNLAFVDRLEPYGHGDGLLTMKDGSALVLSRTFRDRFLAAWMGRA
ncbi:LytR/AlgR family response regulator transcription factor [Geothrix edaphica]|uniref:DNA-binding response regulator n=1 Tax=Geothrix edaphica TaxID=2927976 RepID=A0ABQ5PVE3_9BACT|nr:LytTR family DNA-binding domain-containing protein [Geothrix edaphica]GLH66332.1 DNA-binding response regulator [Geothrix edaphica]